MALVTVHPDYLNFGDGRGPFEYPARYYQDFLEYVASLGAHCWAALPRDVPRTSGASGRLSRVLPHAGAPISSAGRHRGVDARLAPLERSRHLAPSWKARGDGLVLPLPDGSAAASRREALVAKGMTSTSCASGKRERIPSVRR